MKTFIFFLACVLIAPLARGKAEFRDLLRSVLSQDPQFKEIELATPLYEAQEKQGLSKFILPEVSLQYGQYEIHNDAIPSPTGSYYRFGGLNAAFNLFSFGSDYNRYRYARTQRKAQHNRVTSRLINREGELAALLLGYLREVKNVEILGRLVELKEKALSVSRQRYERGTLSEQDLGKVMLDVSNAKAELLVARQDLLTVTAQVKAFGANKLPDDWPWTDELSAARIEELKGLVVPVQDLPQFQEIALEEEASSYQRLARQGALFGALQLNFSRSIYEFRDQDQWEWRTSLVYTLPLFDQFDQYTDLKQSQVLERTNEVRRRYRALQGVSDQEAESAKLELSWQNWMERKDALKITSKIYTSSLSQFNRGQLSVNELFVDQDRLLRTEQIANLSLYQLHASVLAFCHSRGRSYVTGCWSD